MINTVTEILDRTLSKDSSKSVYSTSHISKVTATSTDRSEESLQIPQNIANLTIQVQSLLRRQRF